VNEKKAKAIGEGLCCIGWALAGAYMSTHGHEHGGFWCFVCAFLCSL
jgi:hypothetical protein